VLLPCAGKSAHAAAFADTPSEGGPLHHDGFTPGSLPDMQAAAAGSEGADDMDLDLNPEGEGGCGAQPKAKGLNPRHGAQPKAQGSTHGRGLNPRHGVARG
jgi:hypothetical protein